MPTRRPQPADVVATPAAVRRLAVTRQHLAGPLPDRPSADTVVRVVRDLPFVQWDPAGMTPSHLLALWSRVGDFDRAELDRLLWDERRLLLHWTPTAWLVPTEDYPLYASLMQRYPASLSRSWGGQRRRAEAFLAEHGALRERVLRELAQGPRTVSGFADHVRGGKSADGWTPASHVATMLHHLHMQGEVLVVNRSGNQNVWGLTGAFLPDWVARDPMPQDAFEREAARRALRALGTATPKEIHYTFVRGRYDDVKGALAALRAEGAVRRVRVEAFGAREERYVLEEDVEALAALEDDARWQPRLSLLAPFDNLLHHRGRLAQLFGFEYVHEQFLPASKRRYGTFVLPVLWGDRLIGRIDPTLDRERGILTVRAVHAEPGAPVDGESGAALAGAIERLAGWLGAGEIAYPDAVPPGWAGSLR